jgi:hypothetical protein
MRLGLALVMVLNNGGSSDFFSYGLVLDFWSYFVLAFL